MTDDLSARRRIREEAARASDDIVRFNARTDGHAGGGLAGMQLFLEREHAEECRCGSTSWAGCTAREA